MLWAFCQIGAGRVGCRSGFRKRFRSRLPNGGARNQADMRRITARPGLSGLAAPDWLRRSPSFCSWFWSPPCRRWRHSCFHMLSGSSLPSFMPGCQPCGKASSKAFGSCCIRPFPKGVPFARVTFSRKLVKAFVKRLRLLKAFRDFYQGCKAIRALSIQGP